MNAKSAGLAVVFLFFFIGGTAHFVMPEFFIRIMPPYIPLHREAVLLSGAIELILAFCLLKPSLRPLTGWALIALICTVSLANLHMSMNPELFPEFPQWALTLRWFIQAGLLWLVWWSTRPSRS